MFRIALIGALGALVCSGVRASDLSCGQSERVSLNEFLESPPAYLGKCVTLRGIVRVAGKVGVTISPPGNTSAGEQHRYLSLYFDANEPVDLQNHSQYLEISGRVLGCSDIWKHAEEMADRENNEEKFREHRADGIEVVRLGMVFGVCHYKSDALAVLVSGYEQPPIP
jgi:hypothetical protein